MNIVIEQNVIRNLTIGSLIIMNEMLADKNLSKESKIFCLASFTNEIEKFIAQHILNSAELKKCTNLLKTFDNKINALNI